MSMNDVAGNPNAMMLVGIDDKFGWNSCRLERLIHLFRTNNRYIEVVFTGHKECRSANRLYLKERIRQIEPFLRIFPRLA